MVGTLLDTGADPDITDNSRNTPLLMAAGADPNRWDIYGYTPLHRVVSNGDVDAVAILLRYGDDVHIKDISGRSVLDAVRSEPGTKTLALVEAVVASAVVAPGAV